jgi:hypothetical protein
MADRQERHIADQARLARQIIGAPPGRPRVACARDFVSCSGRRSVFIPVEAWQDNRPRPFALAGSDLR